MQTKNNKKETHFYVSDSRFIYKQNNNFILIWDYLHYKKDNLLNNLHVKNDI